MRVPFIAAAILAAVVFCSAADPECIHRKEHGLPMSWAKPTDCGAFYRCTNKNMVREIACPSGKEYSPRAGKCVAAGRNACKLNKQQALPAADGVCTDVSNGAYVPDPTACRNFYICVDNVGIQQACDPKSYFNITARACIPDTETACWQNKCIDEKNGVYLPDTSSCTTFYVCSNNETIKQRCDVGGYFNPTIAACLPDTDNALCFENFCIGKGDGTLVADPTDCTAYYNCSNEQPEARQCAADNYFDVSLGVCMPGECPAETTTESCTEVTTTVAPKPDIYCCGKADGTVVADPDDCYAYYYCENQQGTKTQCLEGYYFDATDAICKLGSCPTDEVCTCPGGYKEGDFVQHPDGGMLFFICDAGVLVEQSCLAGNVFDPTVSACMPETEEKFSAPITEATKLATKNKTKTKTKQKLKGNAKREKRSVDDIDDSLEENDVADKYDVAEAHELLTVAQPPLTCLGIYREGQFVPHVDDCRKFHICYDGELYEQSCGIGKYFNAAVNMCEPDTEQICPLQTASVVVAESTAANSSGCTCPGGYAEGTLLPYPGECALYYICHNSLLVEGNCGEGMLFDNTTLTCVLDTSNVCWPANGGCTEPDVCQGQADGTSLPVPYECNAFYYCTNQNSTLYYCDPGYYFNAAVEICLPDTEAVCINPCANTTGIITTLPHPDCSRYYLCNNGQTYVQNCTQGYYDIETGVCSVNAICPSAFCQEQDDYTTFPVPGNSSEFYICIGGAAELKSCLPGTSYDPAVGVCLSAPSPDCDQTVCPDGNEAFPTISGESNAFCFCKGDDAYKEYCPTDYTFNAAIGICFSNAPCDPLVCPNNPDYFVFINRNSSESFCMCVAQQAVIVDCPAGTSFNPTQLLCRAPSAADQNCVANSCVGVPDYTAISPIPGLNGFCFCVDNNPTYFNCPPNSMFNPNIGICQSPLPLEQACDVTQCATETVFPTVNDPFSFCYCLDSNTVILEHCADGTQFNPQIQVCLQSPCNPDVCTGQPDGSNFPANNFTYGYCNCTNQMPQFVPCPSGYMYSADRGECLSEANLYCDITLCANATVSSPYAVPAINDTTAFCYCTGPDTVMKMNCPNNSTFDPTIGVCLINDQSNCTCPGGYADGTFLPHPTDCQLFYICSNTRLIEQSCGAGNYYNAENSVCMPDTTGTCVPTSMSVDVGCVGAYADGEFIAHPTNPQLYLLCADTVLHELDCGTGNVFNAEQGVCVYANSMNLRKRSAPVEEVRTFKILSNFLKKLTSF